MLSKTDLKQIDELLVNRINPIKDDITHIRKDIKTIVNFFDKEYLELRKRIERIEEHLHLSSVS